MPEWDGVELWFADERCVPPDDEESNYRLVAETLLRPAAIAAEQVHRMQGELGPDEGARRYARELADGVARGGGEPPGPPVLDLVVRGIGPDGHVASLVPGADALKAGEDPLSRGAGDPPQPPPAPSQRT